MQQLSVEEPEQERSAAVFGQDFGVPAATEEMKVAKATRDAFGRENMTAV
jgi:hypothetical protein